MKDEKSPTNEKLYIVEKLLQKRIEDNQLQYFVKWENYPVSESTWEPVKELPDSSIAEYEKQMMDKFNNQIQTHEHAKYSEIVSCFKTSTNSNEIIYLVREAGKTKTVKLTEEDIKAKYPLLLIKFLEKHTHWHEVPMRLLDEE